MSDESNFGLYTIVVLSILLFNQVTSYQLEIRHFHYINESGVAIIIGAIVGFIAYSQNSNLDISLSKEFFIFVLVPILFYAEAYTMQKKFFFKYFLYIFFFGIVSTLLNVCVIFGLTSLVNQLGYILAGGQIIDLYTNQIMYFSIIMTSMECVVGKSVVNEHYRPKLHSVLFGEELLNEVTIYSLFVTLTTMDSQTFNNSTTWYLYFIGNATLQFFLSLILGIVIGVIFTITTKLFTHMLKSEVAVTIYVFYVGYLSYSISKQLHLPGAVTIFIVGLIFSHYLSYNMPYRCFEASRNTLKTIAHSSETLIFLYLGISLAPLLLHAKIDVETSSNISWSFIGAEIIIIVVSRFFCFGVVVAIMLLFRIKTLLKFRLSVYDLLIVCSSGLVRGSVAFALIKYASDEMKMKMPETASQSIKMLTSAVQILIIACNLIFGFIIPFIAKKCFERNKASEFDEESKQQRKESMSILCASGVIEKKVASTKTAKRFDKTKQFLRRLDEDYFKPFMIHKYKQRKFELNQQRLLKVTQQNKRQYGFHKRSNSDEQKHLQADLDLTKREYDTFNINNCSSILNQRRRRYRSSLESNSSLDVSLNNQESIVQTELNDNLLNAYNE